MQCLPPNTMSELSIKKAPFLKRLRFKRAQNWESPSTKRVSEGSNPTSYPKTAFGIYGNFNKKSGSKHPERLDAVGFAPTASKVLGCYGGGRWIRTTEGIASRFTVCPLWPLGNSPILNSSDDGAGGRTRTPDLLITNQLLYRLSYTSV